MTHKPWTTKEVRELRDELTKGSQADLHQFAAQRGRTYRAVKAMASRCSEHVLKMEPSVRYGFKCKVCKEEVDWDQTPKEPIELLEYIKAWEKKHRSC